MLRLILFTMLTLATVSQARAQEGNMEDETQSESSSSVTAKKSNERVTRLEIGFRHRTMSVPRAVVNIWFIDEDSPVWTLADPRPNIDATSYGMELAILNNGAMGVFYFDYIDSNMSAGYWNVQLDPPIFDLGDYLEPSSNLGYAAFGTNYYQNIAIVSSKRTNGVFGLHFLIGGGAGIGIRTGEINRWKVTELGYSGLYQYLDGEDPTGEAKIPKFVPMLDVNGGLRFTIGDRLTARIEGGLHSMIYWGASAGLMF